MQRAKGAEAPAASQLGTEEAVLLLDYLKRHITTDHEVHGPMARRLLEHLFIERDQKNLLPLARAHVEKALEAQIALWNGLYEILNKAGD